MGLNPFVETVSTGGAASSDVVVASVGSFAGWPVLGAILAIPLLLWTIVRLVARFADVRGRIVASASAVALLSVVGLVVVQRAADPGTAQFVYDGNALSQGVVPGSEVESPPPLTGDPATGEPIASVQAGASLEVSCLTKGRFNDTGSVLWAKIVGGNYRSLWVPYRDLRAMVRVRGAGRSLRDCSYWRWWIQDQP